MKTRAIEFLGSCELGRCGTHNDTPSMGGVEVVLDGDLSEGDMGDMICCDCALWLAGILKKRVREAREKQAKGLEYSALPGSDVLKWRKRKPSTPKMRDRRRCEDAWNAAGGMAQDCDERRDSQGVVEAQYDEQNYAIALDIHRGACASAAIAELRRRYDVLSGYLMLRGGTDFVNACRAAIAEERWGDLVEGIAALERDQVRGRLLRWGKDEHGNRIAVEVEPGRYHIPENLYPGHPFDERKA